MDFYLKISILVEICKIEVKILQKGKVVNIVKNFLTLQKCATDALKMALKKTTLKQ